MTQRSRHLVAVVIVTAALCADRAIAAAPALTPAVGQIASRLVDGFARKLSRTVTGVKLRQNLSETHRPAIYVAIDPVAPVGLHATPSPFQFRLPPPLL